MPSTVSWSGAQSAVLESSGDGYGNFPASTWDGLANGQLKNVLTASYGSGDPFVPNLTLFAHALRDYGLTVEGFISVPPGEAGPNGTLRDLISDEGFTFSLDSSGKPQLYCNASPYDGGATLIVRIQSRYSASE